jgi:hypothetical protein
VKAPKTPSRVPFLRLSITTRNCMQKLAHTFVLMTVALTIGLHWAVLQSVAWAGMFAAYSQENSISQSFRKTFSGEEPCRICDLVQEGRGADSDEKTFHKSVKLDFFNEAGREITVAPVNVEFSLEHLFPRAERLAYPPHSPPPNV